MQIKRIVHCAVVLLLCNAYGSETRMSAGEESLHQMSARPL